MGLAAILLAGPDRGAAQVAPNTANTYLLPTDVGDARALWVNPAGLASTRPEAAVYLDATIGNPGSAGRLRQLTAGFNSRGFSVGYQRDVFDGGARGHTYRMGLAGAAGGLSAGFATALYRGDTKGTGWDVGVNYDVGPGGALRVGGVITNLGQPTVRGLRQILTFVPAASVRPFGPDAVFSLDGRLSTHRVQSYSFEARWSRVARRPIQLLARMDTDGGLRRGAFAFGIALGGSDMVGLVGATPGDVARVDALSLYGVSVRASPGRHR